MRDAPERHHLVEMAFTWPDIEKYIEGAAAELSLALDRAYRVDAASGSNHFGDPNNTYAIYVDPREDRDAIRSIRDHADFLDRAIKSHVQLFDNRCTHDVHAIPPEDMEAVELDYYSAVPCERLRPRTGNVSVDDVPVPKASGTGVPFENIDGYELTPIEVPFYKALRETGATFAVQPFVQGTDHKYRPDFIVFYDGRAVVVELDGHEGHKTKDQRTRDAQRQRWFEARGLRVMRFTGSEVYADVDACVSSLMDVLRQSQSRF